MKKKVILLSLIVVILALCFIPCTQQETILIKSPFLNIYSLLVNPLKWEKWRPELRKTLDADSSKISIKKDSSSFIVKYENLESDVKFRGTAFDINDNFDGKTAHYSYTLIPVADRFQNKTNVIVVQQTNAINYLIGKLWAPSFSDTHIADLKNFMEVDSLHYGFKISKTSVPESNLIVITRKVLKGDKFTNAANMLATLRQYVKNHDVKQMYPIITQFLTKGKDSVQIKVGFFIDKEVSSDHEIIFTRMPKGGPLYSAEYKGKFSKRGAAYDALTQYFTDHVFQSAILPFEIYLDNKLPVNDDDTINITVNFSTYPSGDGR